MKLRGANGFRWQRAAAALLLGMSLAGGALGQGAANGADPLAERFRMVNALIENSSAALEIERGGVAQASERREQARRLYREAGAARDAGNRERAGQLLNQASTTMFEAARLVDSHPGAAKAERDFATRLESVDALLAAHARVCEEKACNASAMRKFRDSVSAKVAAAKEGFARDPAGARRQLDLAYQEAKAAIEDLRGGETLVRSLQFKNKEEEYRYELDRNDTHKMLVTVLLTEKLGDPAVERRTRPFLSAAAELRARAEGEAGKGLYEKAIETLELSTRELLRALRGAGIYIPG